MTNHHGQFAQFAAAVTRQLPTDLSPAFMQRCVDHQGELREDLQAAFSMVRKDKETEGPSSLLVDGKELVKKGHVEFEKGMTLRRGVDVWVWAQVLETPEPRYELSIGFVTVEERETLGEVSFETLLDLKEIQGAVSFTAIRECFMNSARSWKGCLEALVAQWVGKMGKLDVAWDGDAILFELDLPGFELFSASVPEANLARALTLKY